MELLAPLLQLGLGVGVVAFAWAVGRNIEESHFRQLAAREAESRSLLAISVRSLPEGWSPAESGLALGSVVVSIDHFKRLSMTLKSIVGGRIRSMEPVMERARREALLRMKDHARAQGFDAVFNVRLETSTIASSLGGGKGTAGVEVLAYGTAVKRT